MIIIRGPQSQFIKKHISATLLVALVSGVGYLGAFAYQWSYLSYFGVPSYFVSINIGTVLFVSLVAFIWFALLGQVLYLVLKVKGTSILKKTLHYIGLSVLLLIYFLPILLPLDFWTRCIVVILIVASLVYLIWFSDKKKENHDFLNEIQNEYGAYIILLTGALILFFVYSCSFGVVNAKLRSTYLISDQKSDLVVLGTYSENFIAVTYSPETNKVLGGITILSQEDISKEKFSFTPRVIGTLTSTSSRQYHLFQCLSHLESCI